MNLKSAEEGKEYIIKSIETDDEELDAFLFSLGCYSGEPITVVSHLKKAVLFPSRTGDPILITSLRKLSLSDSPGGRQKNTAFRI